VVLNTWGLFDERQRTTRPIHKQPSDTRDDGPEGKILDELLISAQTKSEEANDLDRRVGIRSQKIQ
jgi:hypothetical protein